MCFYFKFYTYNVGYYLQYAYTQMYAILIILCPFFVSSCLVYIMLCHNRIQVEFIITARYVVIRYL